MKENELNLYDDRKRLVYLDIARGICILLVVFGHTLIPNIRENNKIIQFIYDYIYFFHMPVFFIISGIIFENNINRLVIYYIII